MLFKSKSNKEASTAKIAVWYLISTLLVNGLGAISAPIFTRVMSKADYGMFNNYVAIEGLLMTIISLQLNTSIARAKYDFADKMDKYISSLIIVSNFFCVVFFLVVESIPDFFSKLFSLDITYIRIMIISLMFAPTFAYVQAKHRVFKKYKLFTALSLTTAIIRTMLGIILVIFLQNKIFGRIAGYVFPIMLLNVVMWIGALYRGKGISKEVVKYAFVIAIPMIPNALAGNLLSTSDTIIITKICGSDKTAIYTLAYTISSLASCVWVAMNQAWAPWMYDKLHEGKVDEVKKNSIYYIIIFILIIFPILLLAPEIILIFGGKAYQEAKYVIPPVVVGLLAQLIYGLYVNTEIYMKKTTFISVATFLAAAINIGLNIVFIPKFGYIAAAYTTLIGYFLMMVFHYINVHRLKEYATLFDNKKIFCLFLLVFILHFVVVRLYLFNFIRYILLGIYLITILTILLIFKDKLWKR